MQKSTEKLFYTTPDNAIKLRNVHLLIACTKRHHYVLQLRAIFTKHICTEKLNIKDGMQLSVGVNKLHVYKVIYTLVGKRELLL